MARVIVTGGSGNPARHPVPGVHVTRELGTHETLLSVEKARRAVGYDPKHSWGYEGRDAAE
jgi:hypothetical protein